MKVLLFILKLISRLPLKVLYIFSDLIFVASYYLAGYRKNVVFENLKKSFPEKSHEQIKKIQKAFFRNFSDYIVETLKAMTISETELRVRMQHINQHVFHEAKEEGKNVILLAGHVFNWEWITALAAVIPQEKCYGVYRKIRNKFWEEQIIKIRNKSGNYSLEAKDVMRQMLRNPNDGNSVYLFIADQSPKQAHVDTGTVFLNQETPVFTGYDKIATRMNLAFVYCEMKKVKRGFYQVNYYRIYPDGEKFEPFEIVRKFHIYLENTIRKRPDNYLWSHRRWKYTDHIKHMI